GPPVRARVGRDDDRWHPWAVDVVAAGDVAGPKVGRDVVGLDRGRRRDVVVVAAVLVVELDEERARPRRRVQHGVHDAGHEGLPELDVLRVLLRLALLGDAVADRL